MSWRIFSVCMFLILVCHLYHFCPYALTRLMTIVTSLLYAYFKFSGLSLILQFTTSAYNTLHPKNKNPELTLLAVLLFSRSPNIMNGMLKATLRFIFCMRLNILNQNLFAVHHHYLPALLTFHQRHFFPNQV